MTSVKPWDRCSALLWYLTFEAEEKALYLTFEVEEKALYLTFEVEEKALYLTFEVEKALYLTFEVEKKALYLLSEEEERFLPRGGSQVLEAADPLLNCTATRQAVKCQMSI